MSEPIPICRSSVVRVLRLSRLALLVPLAACATETLFESDFDATPVNQPPATAQAVGTAAVDGPAGSVLVVAPPVTPSGNWVQISRPGADSPVAGLQGNFSEFGGEGEYTFTTTLFMPTGSGLATLQCEPFGQPVGTLTSFLHIDFTRENDVRIDDKEETRFGTFPRDQPFIVQVQLNIGASSATAHIALAGAGASGAADYGIEPALLTLARQFGAIRVWMGFPSTGTFDATNIVVTRKTD
ncbi:MAG: hypothetical protein EYC70_01040 [Planctomycetota bacterium]|nr:MAG: hypothetical protein EYC70_01040 [Planctomycetota bacterium]